MSHEKRGTEIINSLEITTTTTGKPVAKLYSAQTELKYPILDLFDLTALAAVGIDPNTAPRDRRIYLRARAHWVSKGKTKSTGNEYRDVEYLEPLAPQAEPGSAAIASLDLVQVLTRIENQLADIRHLLEYELPWMIHRALTGQPPGTPQPPPREARPAPPPVDETTGELVDDDPVLRYANGLAVADNPAEVDAYLGYLQAEGHTPADVDALRDWFEAQQPA